jgi:putative FmdB family regulatory protein
VPTYQYACTECGHRFEAVQSFHEDSLTHCPECDGRLRKVFNAVGVVFKGSGFYRNDSRSGAASASSDSGTDSSKDSGKDSSSSDSRSSSGGSQKSETSSTPAAATASSAPSAPSTSTPASPSSS